MTKKGKIFFYILSAISFCVSVVLLCVRFSSFATIGLMNCIQIFRPDITIEKIHKLYSFIECNIVLFIIYGISFIVLTKIEFSDSIGNKFKFFPPIKTIKVNRYNLILLLIFILITVIRFYWITQKKSFHMDELYGISIFHYNEYGLWSGKNFEKLQPFTGKEIRDLILFDDESVKDTFKDLAHLWIYNRDTAYNNLFLVLSRIWYTGFETSSFKTIFWRASLLNYVFFCFSFYFLYRLLNEISNSKISKALTLIVAFLNPASIGLSVFMRSYALQETVLILFTYLFVLYLKNISQKKDVNNKQNFISTVIVLSLIINCDYFSILYVAILGLILIAYLVWSKEYKTLYSLISALLASLIVSKIFYLNFGVGFFTGRGAESLDALSSFGDRVQKAFDAVYVLISNNFINIFICLIVCLISIVFYILFRKKNVKHNNVRICIFASSLLWCLVVMIFSPYYTLRYIAPIFPLIAVIFSFNNNNKYVTIFTTSVLIILTCFISKNVMPFPMNNEKIEHLDDTDGRIFSAEFLKDTNANVYIDRNSLYTEILPYLNDNQVYYFVDSFEELESYDLKNQRCYYLKYENTPQHDIIIRKIEGD